MTPSLFNCMIPVLNVSKKVLQSSVSLCHSAYLRTTVEVRIGGGGVAESSANKNTRTLSSKVESSAAQNENYESRLLKIAIIGVPNAGKSTVINQLVGRKVNTSRS
jgi:tRNA U34 5-carboxymethylaminomethyl modifying GTPase MnmE/TrmE